MASQETGGGPEREFRARKRIAILALLVASALLGSGIAVALQAPAGDPALVELLSGMSYAPNKSSIDLVLGEAAVEDLIAIAEDTSPDSDPGVRIRAYRALGQYALSPEASLAQAALEGAVVQFGAATEGTNLLYLRSSMLALASVGGVASVENLVGLLAHPTRDIRAACAQALAITKAPSADQPLRDRALIETEPQVQLAIADALFVLDSLP